jgi:DNA polymerase-1
MIEVENWLQQSTLNARLTMQVHDELIFEAPAGVKDELIAGVRQHMSAAAKLHVPLKVDIGVGLNWDEAH